MDTNYKEKKRVEKPKIAKHVFRHPHKEIELIRDFLKENYQELNSMGFTRKSLADYIAQKLNFKVTPDSMQSVRMRLHHQGFPIKLRIEKTNKENPKQLILFNPNESITSEKFIELCSIVTKLSKDVNLIKTKMAFE